MNTEISWNLGKIRKMSKTLERLRKTEENEGGDNDGVAVQRLLGIQEELKESLKTGILRKTEGYKRECSWIYWGFTWNLGKSWEKLEETILYLKNKKLGRGDPQVNRKLGQELEIRKI